MSELARHFAKIRRPLLPKDKFRLEEDKIPGDAQGKPDLALVKCGYPDARDDFGQDIRSDAVESLRQIGKNLLFQTCAAAISRLAAQGHSHEET